MIRLEEGIRKLHRLGAERPPRSPRSTFFSYPPSEHARCLRQFEGCSTGDRPTDTRERSALDQSRIRPESLSTNAMVLTPLFPRMEPVSLDGTGRNYFTVTSVIVIPRTAISKIDFPRPVPILPASRLPASRWLSKSRHRTGELRPPVGARFRRTALVVSQPSPLSTTRSCQELAGFRMSSQPLSTLSVPAGPRKRGKLSQATHCCSYPRSSLGPPSRITVAGRSGLSGEI
jgi:hypothetical protein